MNTAPKNQQIEFEVFPRDNKSNYAYLSGIQGDTPRESTQINVVFSHQSVIIIFICAIMLLVGAFSLGVEKGRLLGKNVSPVEKIAAVENMAPTTPEEKSKAVVPPAMLAAKPVVPAPPAPVVSAPQLPQDSGYTVQIASVTSASSADLLVQALAKKGLSGFTRSSGKYVMVMAGNFGKKEEAQASLKELKKTYTDCFIRKI